jgi:hypothetical protein
LSRAKPNSTNELRTMRSSYSEPMVFFRLN